MAARSPPAAGFAWRLLSLAARGDGRAGLARGGRAIGAGRAADRNGCAARCLWGAETGDGMARRARPVIDSVETGRAGPASADARAYRAA
ncbi:hypothetical protein G6F62_015678 [Rhizopus arrhizus]|nr:hypothetical protein G6F62_015678 [Rhizopus arrhizus]